MPKYRVSIYPRYLEDDQVSSPLEAAVDFQSLLLETETILNLQFYVEWEDETGKTLFLIVSPDDIDNFMDDDHV